LRHQNHRQNRYNRANAISSWAVVKPNCQETAGMDDPAFAAAQLVAERLQQLRLRLVLAESCTGGLAAATMTRLPGTTEWFCGSAVVYRLDTKHQWLGVSHGLFQPPGPGVVSREVAEAMVRGALAHTPEADVAGAITGHLGPNAPLDQDGLIWMAAAWRREGDVRVTTASQRLADAELPELPLRECRQRSATVCLLRHVAEALA
jgi:nicotinamide-nucleotide amidase